MHSAPAPEILRNARRASNSLAAHFLARAGLTACGTIYILVGWVAVLVALGLSSREADQTGALQLLAVSPTGWSRSGCSASDSRAMRCGG
jgi:hypothetical protein